ncbi:MAG: DUF2269 domain-containing protein [Gaiellaceae bacterium]
MILTPGRRKLALTAHVVSSVGWLGAVAVFLALAVASLTSNDAETVRAAYLMMDWADWYVLIPLSFASLLTGLVQALGTAWGLFRHYWVLAKLLINLFATIVLLFYTQTLATLGDMASETTPSSDGLGVLRSPSPLLHAGAALLLLVVATVLAVYKPRGRTRYGRRALSRARAPASPP